MMRAEQVRKGMAPQDIASVGSRSRMAAYACRNKCDQQDDSVQVCTLAKQWRSHIVHKGCVHMWGAAASVQVQMISTGTVASHATFNCITFNCILITTVDASKIAILKYRSRLHKSHISSPWSASSQVAVPVRVQKT